jgi:putative FmdB family regulatory protein
MPIFEYRCEKCGQVNEFLVFKKEEPLSCKQCGSKDLTKLLSAHNISSSAPQKGFERGCEGHCDSPQSCGMPGSCCSR